MHFSQACLQVSALHGGVTPKCKWFKCLLKLLNHLFLNILLVLKLVCFRSLTKFCKSLSLLWVPVYHESHQTLPTMLVQHAGFQRMPAWVFQHTVLSGLMLTLSFYCPKNFRKCVLDQNTDSLFYLLPLNVLLNAFSLDLLFNYKVD